MMNRETWQRIEALYYEALELPSDQRADFLTRACAEQAELRREVESLLAAHTEAQGFLDQPAVEGAAQQLAQRSGLTDQSTAQLPAATLPVGQFINQYKILSHLGAGGMGEVYLAEDTRLHRKVALKLLPLHFAKDAARVRRFEQEAHAVSALNHPHIVTLFDLGQAGEQYFMATEYVDGETLRAQLQERGRLPVQAASTLVLQIASALAAAHEAGIVHRDIKPENVMVRRDGYVKVLDFGLAKVSEAATDGAPEQASLSSITEAGAIMGTVSYMSPEQARGLRVDARTDVFSLGVVFYEMLTGQRPFTGATASDIIASILRSEPPPLAEVLVGAPAALQSFLAKALAKERDERHQSMGAFAHELKHLSQELEFAARLADSDKGRSGSTVSALASLTPSAQPRRKLTLAAIVFMGVLLLAVGLWQFYQSRGTTKAGRQPVTAVKTLAVLPFKFIGSTREEGNLSDVLTDALIMKLSNLRQLAVRPTQTVMRFQNSEVKLLDAARALKVDALITGHVQKLGEKVRLNVQLISIAPDSEVEQLRWTGTFNDWSDDLLALQDTLSAQVVRSLALQLTSEEQARLRKRYTDNAQAYQLYLRARFYYAQKSKEGAERATELLNQALALDNRFAPAYVELAHLWTLRDDLGISPANEAEARSIAAARQALALDETLSEAHAILAHLVWGYRFDLLTAEREHLRSLALDPNQPMARQWYSIYLLGRGRLEEGISEIRHAIELDPLDLFTRSQLARALYLAKRYDEAIAVCRELIQMDANHASAYLYMGQAYDLKGDYPAALTALLKAKSLSPSPERMGALGYLYAHYGKRNEALQIVAEMNQMKYQDNQHYYANIYTALGDHEAAFNSLNQAYQQHDPALINRLKIDPKLDPLRADPRFNELLQRLGL